MNTTTDADASGAMSELHLGLTLGALELGILIATFLYGMAFVQGYRYTLSAARATDAWWMRMLVSFLAICETAHTLLIWTYLYFVTVTHAGDPTILDTLPWHFDTSLLFSGVIGGTAQAFFTYRVWRVSGSLALAVPGWLGAAARVGLACALCVVAFSDHVLSALRGRYDPVVYGALGVSVVVDAWNTLGLCFYLKSTPVANPSTAQIVNSILLWAIETGLATTIFALLVLVSWVTMPSNALWICFLQIYSKLYSISLLTSLASRAVLQERRTRVATGLPAFPARRPATRVSTALTVTITRECMGDDGSVFSPEALPPLLSPGATPKPEQSASDSDLELGEKDAPKYALHSEESGAYGFAL